MLWGFPLCSTGLHYALFVNFVSELVFGAVILCNHRPLKTLKWRGRIHIDAVSVPKQPSLDRGMHSWHAGKALDINIYAQAQQARTALTQASRPVACRRQHSLQVCLLWNFVTATFCIRLLGRVKWFRVNSVDYTKPQNLFRFITVDMLRV